MLRVVSRSSWGAELARARRFARRLERSEPLAPVPPPLPAGRVVELPGRGEIFVREASGPVGSPTILLLHGWTASADLNWFRVYDTVSSLGRMIAVDHRGHGRGIRTEETFRLEAAADDAAALVRELEAGPVVAVGYSMGGPIAMLLARRHPGLVSGLVLQATALEWRTSVWERVIWKTMAFAEYLLRMGAPRGLVERALRDAVETDPSLREWLGWLKGELRRGDPEALAAAGRALGEYDARPFAADVRVPAAVVVTTGDRLVRPRKQRKLAAAIPGARTFEVAGDHDVCLVRPDAFRAVTELAIRSVLDRLDARTAMPGEPSERSRWFSRRASA